MLMSYFRYRRISRVLSNQPVETIFRGRNCLDTVASDFLPASHSTTTYMKSSDSEVNIRQAPLIGWIFDRYGPKYLLFSGSFLHVFGLMMTSISTKYYQVMLAQGVCSGIGAAIIYLPGFQA